VPVELAAALRDASRRLCARDVLLAIAAAAPIAATLAAMLLRAGWSTIPSGTMALALTTGLSSVWLWRRSRNWTSAAAALALERASSSSRNVIVTAEELSRHPDRARPWIRARVLTVAAGAATAINASHAVPLRRHTAIALVAVGLGAAILVGIAGRAARAAAQVVARASDRALASDELRMRATIAPPSYTRQRARSLDNPDRLEAVQGSQLRLTIQGDRAWRVRFGNDALKVTRTSSGITSDLALSASGYLAIESDAADASKSRRLIPVTVTPDRAPTIRVEAPGKDLLLPDARPSIGIAASATDDYGLQSLELRYTKASGSGEQFEFQEGVIPLDIARNDHRDWKARAAVALSQLGLEPGDALVYRLVARDERPGDAGTASSDTFFIEIAGPGQVALPGFELPPDRERYALSQQMIVLKIERLRAREAALAPATLATESSHIGAEQRAVRANFVFLMGGHIEDEEVEAEQSHEIQEGRLENTARREIVAAVQHMGKSEAGLASTNLAAALTSARAAVEALQRAFGRNRYILRTLPVRGRIDPSRRLTGETTSASDWQRTRQPADVDQKTRAARELLAQVLGLSPSITSGTAEPSTLTAVAEQALAVDPGDEQWQGISRRLLQARDAVAAGRADAVELLRQAVAPIVGLAERDAIAAKPVEIDTSLRSAWLDERHKR
jgi:hypothetical protein